MIFELISKVLINVLLISVFISIFYFTYGVYIEKTAIDTQMKLFAEGFMNFFELTGRTSNQKMYDYVNNDLLSPTSIKKISEDDEKALKGNKKILEDVIIYITFFFLFVVIFLVILINMGLVTNIGEILIESSIILAFIGLTEFIFLTFFGPKFISLDMNQIKYKIASTLEKYRKSL